MSLVALYCAVAAVCKELFRLRSLCTGTACSVPKFTARVRSDKVGWCLLCQLTRFGEVQVLNHRTHTSEMQAVGNMGSLRLFFRLVAS